MDFGYVWDEEKYALVQQDHGVDIVDVVTALEDTRSISDDDPQGNPGRYMIVGRCSDRILQVICSEEDEDDYPLIRIVTAFEANIHWRRAYEQQN